MYISDDKRTAEFLSTKFDDSWARRVKTAEAYNARLESGEIQPGLLKRAKWTLRAATQNGTGGYTLRRQTIEQEWREKSGRKEASLAWALNDVFGFDFWCAGLFKVRFREFVNCKS